MTPDQLPRAWERIPLRDAGTWLSGGTPTRDVPAFWGGDVPWIGSKDVKGFLISDASEHITRLGAEAGSRILPPGTLLMVTRGMSLVNEFRVGVTTREVAFNQDVKALVPTNGLDARFLGWYLRAVESHVLSLVDTASHGTKRLPSERLAQVLVPVPPLPEQRRIAYVLDRTEGLVRHRATATNLLASLLDSILMQVLGPPAGWASKWDWQPLSTLIHDARNGLSPSTTGVVRGRVLSTAAITGPLFNPMAAKDAMFDHAPAADQMVSAGRALFCRGSGNLSMVGAMKVVPEGSVESLAFPDTVIGASLRANLVRAPFLEAVWSTPTIRAQVEAAARTTNGTYKVNQETLGAVRVPVPPVEVQDRFARHVDTLTGVRRHQLTSSGALDALSGTILHRAFTGEL